MEWPWIVILLVLGIGVFLMMRRVGASDPLPDAPNRLVIDARSPSEFVSGHIPGAQNVPYDDVARMAKLIGDKDRAVIVYCLSGSRSGVAVRKLRQMGFTAIANGGGVYGLARNLGVTLVR